MIQKRMTAVASGAVLALGLTACAGDSTTTTPTPGAGAVVSNAAVGKIFAPSDAKGGTLRFGMPGDWDSVDPGDT